MKKVIATVRNEDYHYLYDIARETGLAMELLVRDAVRKWIALDKEDSSKTRDGLKYFKTLPGRPKKLVRLYKDYIEENKGRDR